MAKARRIVTSMTSAQAIQLERKIVLASEELTTAWLRMGRLLCEAQEKQIHLLRGYTQFIQWAKAVIPSFKERTFYNAMGVYKKFVERKRIDSRSLESVGFAKLVILSPVADKLPFEDIRTLASKQSCDELRQTVKLLSKTARRKNGKELVQEYVNNIPSVAFVRFVFSPEEKEIVDRALFVAGGAYTDRNQAFVHICRSYVSSVANMIESKKA